MTTPNQKTEPQKSDSKSQPTKEDIKRTVKEILGFWSKQCDRLLLTPQHPQRDCAKRLGIAERTYKMPQAWDLYKILNAIALLSANRV